MLSPAPRRRVLALWLALAASPIVVQAKEPADIVGTPQSVAIDAGDASLIGRRATRQMIASGRYADGSVRDLTRDLEWASLQPEVATVSPRGQVIPKADGSATIVGRLGGIEASAVVRVEKFAEPHPVSFRRDVIPAFSQAGCNMGACHGTPTGKGGFRLSLRGYLPDQDFSTLVRGEAGRRISAVRPESSLILTKPLGEVAHEGGLRLDRGTKTYEYLRDWVAEGAKDDSTAPAAVALEISPAARVLDGSVTTQQVAVQAKYADGSRRDITPLCYYSASSPEIADVDPTGYVRFKTRGEVAIIAHYLDLVANVRLTHLVEVPGFVAAPVPTDNTIDAAVFGKLNRMRIRPSEACSDVEFLRRSYLDALGILPRPAEVRAFLSDTAPDRRTKLVDALLARPEFLDFWTLKLADILRANGRLIQTKGTHVFHRWIRENLARNTPMDEFVRELLTADGSTFQNPPSNYYRISRDPETSVETTAQLFLGVRIQCAKCHNHPFERWTQDDYYGFAAFFARVKRKAGNLPEEEVVFSANDGEVRQPRTGKVMPPKALGGPVFDAKGTDRRDSLAAWLTGPENPFFAKSLANRVWFHLVGRGVVEPVDDFRDSNPSSNDELLDALASGFVRSRYDLKALIRSILTSRTYALSARSNELNVDDSLYFSHAQSKLLPAEVLLDAISTFTATTTAFEGLPSGTRATQIPDGKLENPFLRTFGRPARELACECERESDTNLSQALQLIGGPTVNGKLHDDAGRMAELAKSPRSAEEITRELYLTAVSREPTSTEMEIAIAYLKAAPDRRQAVEDLGWSLINSMEFLFRH